MKFVSALIGFILLECVTSESIDHFGCLSDGIFPHPVACQEFYSCSNGIAYKMRCPRGTRFNERLRICDHTHNVKCAQLRSSVEEPQFPVTATTFQGNNVRAKAPKTSSSGTTSATTEATTILTKQPKLVSGVDYSKSNFTRGCYMTNWAQYRPGSGRYFPEDYAPGLCDYLFFAFATLNHKDEITNYEWNDLDRLYPAVKKLKSADPSLKTLLSLGGWNFGTRRFKELSASAEKRSAFIRSVVSFLREHGFDGLDVDWEYPENASDKTNMVTLFEELLEEFNNESRRTDRPRLLLTAAVSAAPEKIDAGYDLPALNRLLDLVNLMSYDFHGAWENTVDANSPMYARRNASDAFKHWNVIDSANHWINGGLSKKKLLIGLPTYGRGWSVENANRTQPGSGARGPSTALAYTREAGVASYYEVCELLTKGGQQFWDNETATPYLVHKDQWISYDDANSFSEKINWIIANGFGGAFVWTLDMDDFSGTFCGKFHDGHRYPLVSLLQKMMLN